PYTTRCRSFPVGPAGKRRKGTVGDRPRETVALKRVAPLAAVVGYHIGSPRSNRYRNRKIRLLPSRGSLVLKNSRGEKLSPNAVELARVGAGVARLLVETDTRCHAVLARTELHPQLQRLTVIPKDSARRLAGEKYRAGAAAARCGVDCDADRRRGRAAAVIVSGHRGEGIAARGDIFPRESIGCRRACPDLDGSPEKLHQTDRPISITRCGRYFYISGSSKHGLVPGRGKADRGQLVGRHPGRIKDHIHPVVARLVAAVGKRRNGRVHEHPVFPVGSAGKRRKGTVGDRPRKTVALKRVAPLAAVVGYHIGSPRSNRYRNRKIRLLPSRRGLVLKNSRGEKLSPNAVELAGVGAGVARLLVETDTRCHAVLARTELHPQLYRLTRKQIPDGGVERRKNGTGAAAARCGVDRDADRRRGRAAAVIVSGHRGEGIAARGDIFPRESIGCRRAFPDLDGSPEKLHQTDRPISITRCGRYFYISGRSKHGMVPRRGKADRGQLVGRHPGRIKDHIHPVVARLVAAVGKRRNGRV